MTQVPSTKTYNDAFARIKELNQEIAKLISLKEINEAKAKDSIDNLDGLLGRIKDAEEHLGILENEINHFNVRSEEHISNTFSIFNRISLIMDNYLIYLKNLDKKESELKEIINSLIEKKINLQKTIESEEIRLQKREDDLKIYEKRINKLVEENNLDNIKIIL